MRNILPSSGDLVSGDAIKKKILFTLLGWVGVPVLSIVLIISLVIFVLLFLIHGTKSDTDESFCVAFPLEATDPTAVAILNDKCYKKSLLYAEERTNVPWQIIAAADYVYWRQGRLDLRKTQHNGNDIPKTNQAAMIEIGKDIQMANKKRDANGSPSLDIDGLQQETIFPSMITLKPKKESNETKDIAMGRVIDILTNYRCFSILDAGFNHKVKGPDGNYVTMVPVDSPQFEKIFKDYCALDKEYKGKHFSDFAKVDPWLWSGLIKNNDGLKEALLDDKKKVYGAVAFYKYLVDGTACGTAVSPGLPSGAIAHLMQGDPRWAGNPYACDNIGGSGCAVTSLTMVLNFYGANTTPDVVAEQAASTGGATCGEGSTTTMYEGVVNTYYPYLDVQNVTWEQALQLLEQKAPIIVGVKLGVYDHLTVLTEKNGDTLTIDDPAKDTTTTSSVADFLSTKISGGVIKYVRKK